MNKRAAIYARVSTDDQADTGYSLPSQIEACRGYAENLGYSVVVEMLEDYSGAAPISERPQGRLLTRMVAQHEVEVVIVHQVDRLSRDIVDLLTTVRNWIRAGIEVHAGDIGKVESELDIVLVIKGWQGSDERKKIRERSMRGKRAKALAGRVIGGRPPYGYQHTRDENKKIVNFEIVEEEAEIIRLIYQWYVYGDEDGKRLSAMGISRRLSQMRIPTPGELSKGYHRQREAGIWQPDKVIKILSHEVYIGTWYYGARIGSTRDTRAREEWIAVDVPAIIDRDTWDAAQAQRQQNKLMAKRNAKYDYLLSGLVKCGCGFSMCGEYFSNHRYYTCSWKNNHYGGIENKTCRARSVRAEAVEADVWDSIVGLFSDLERFERLLRIAQQEEIETMDPKRAELETIEGMIQDAEYEAAEIGQALKRASGIVGKTLQQDMNNVNRRYDALVSRRDILEKELEGRRLTDPVIDDLVQYADDVRRGIDNADYDMRRYTLETLQARVVVQDGRFYVTSLVGEWDGDIRLLPRAGQVGIVTDSCLPTRILRGCRIRAGTLQPGK